MESQAQTGMQAIVPGKAPEKARQTSVAAAGLLGALASMSCCIIPLFLFSIGVSGAWMGNLTALYPYKPYFIVFALSAIGWGFWMTRTARAGACENGTVCARPLPNRLVRASLWLSLLFTLAAIAFPWIAPLLLGRLN